jgi:hypothetical protein
MIAALDRLTIYSFIETVMMLVYGMPGKVK